MKQGKATPCTPKGEPRRERALERKATLTSGVRGYRLAFLSACSLDNCGLKASSRHRFIALDERGLPGGVGRVINAGYFSYMNDFDLGTKLEGFLQGSWAGAKRVQGIQGGAKAYVLSLVAEKSRRPILIIAPTHGRR